MTFEDAEKLGAILVSLEQAKNGLGEPTREVIIALEILVRKAVDDFYAEANKD
jgi:hypothetical protein